MNIYDKFESKEKILAFLEKYIEKDDEGNYFLPEANNIEKDKELECMKNELKTLKNENERLKYSTHTEDGSKEETPSLTKEDQEAIKMYSHENEGLHAQNEELKQELEDLQKEIENYRQKEVQESVRKTLQDEASKLGIRSEAMRDVERLIYLIKENEDGSLTTEDGLTIVELLKKELSLSPHWLPNSQAGGSYTIQPFFTNIPQNVRFENAKRNQDLNGMILNAPIIE